MKKIFILLVPLILLYCVEVWAQNMGEECEDLSVKAEFYNDTLRISLSSQCRKIQLSFLMQGVCVGFVEKSRSDTAFVEFPTASDVRTLIKRHPNEVKAMHYGNGLQEVRPDLLPLVDALNSQKAKFIKNGNESDSCRHCIAINKESGSITFVAVVPIPGSELNGDSLALTISSIPRNYKDNAEFSGSRRSRENRQLQNGMGDSPDEREAWKRQYRNQVTVGIVRAKKTSLENL